jgi:hypothetical protein
LQQNKEAQLELAMNYAAGNIGNLDQETAAAYVRQVRQRQAENTLKVMV